MASDLTRVRSVPTLGVRAIARERRRLKMKRCTVCGDPLGRARRGETCPDCQEWAERYSLRLWAKAARRRREMRQLRHAAMVLRVAA